jgi:hypothetical protein
MFKKVLFAILWFPLVIIEMPASLISVLVTILCKLIFGLADGKDAYNDFLETKANGWTILKSSLKFDD